jgi:phosphoglucomutase
MDSKKEYEVATVKTEPFQDQIADCKGLIRTAKHFQTPNYVENYIQGCFHVLDILEPV